MTRVVPGMKRRTLSYEEKLLSAFIDAALPLNEEEEAEFQRILNELDPAEREAIMELTTS
jgi:DNA-directed RNA polymerase specialized sigma24 family protein